MYWVTPSRRGQGQDWLTDVQGGLAEHSSRFRSRSRSPGPANGHFSFSVIVFFFFDVHAAPSRRARWASARGVSRRLCPVGGPSRLQKSRRRYRADGLEGWAVCNAQVLSLVSDRRSARPFSWLSRTLARVYITYLTCFTISKTFEN